MNKRIRNKKAKQEIIKFIFNRYSDFATKKEIKKIIRNRNDLSFINQELIIPILRPFGFDFFEFNPNDKNWQRITDTFGQIVVNN